MSDTVTITLDREVARHLIDGEIRGRGQTYWNAHGWLMAAVVAALDGQEAPRRCGKCGAPRGSDHDASCPTESWKVLESQCQPEDERESTEEATAKLRRPTDRQAEDPDLWQKLPPHTIGAKLQTELRKLHEAIQVADEEEAVGLVSQALKSFDAATQSEQSHIEEGNPS